MPTYQLRKPWPLLKTYSILAGLCKGSCVVTSCSKVHPRVMADENPKRPVSSSPSSGERGRRSHEFNTSGLKTGSGVYYNEWRTRHRSQWLTEHSRLCNQQLPVKTIYPQGEKAIITFNKTSHQYRIPIVVYADFESSLCAVEPIDNATNKRESIKDMNPIAFV